MTVYWTPSRVSAYAAGVPSTERPLPSSPTAADPVAFEEALKNVNKSVSNDDLENFDKWMAEFGSV